MTDVKWIKLATDVFDNRKIRQIEMMPDGDSIVVLWFKLLCLAGNINDRGYIYFTSEIPYTEQMLANQFNRPLSTVQLALKTFQRFGMIDVVDNIIHLSSWERYQNVDGLEKIREQTRKRVAKHREQKRLEESNVTCNFEVTHGNAIERDIEEDKDKEEEEEQEQEERPRIDYQRIVDLYNKLCPSLPAVRSLSEARKKAIGARLKTYTVEDFRTVFENAQASSFLKGGNKNNWTANFDWLMKDANMAKVLDGNYQDRKAATRQQSHICQSPVEDDLAGIF